MWRPGPQVTAPRSMGVSGVAVSVLDLLAGITVVQSRPCAAPGPRWVLPSSPPPARPHCYLRQEWLSSQELGLRGPGAWFSKRQQNAGWAWPRCKLPASGWIWAPGDAALLLHCSPRTVNPDSVDAQGGLASARFSPTRGSRGPPSPHQQLAVRLRAGLTTCEEGWWRTSLPLGLPICPGPGTLSQ